MALLSVMAKHYGWPPWFWRRMGTREFYLWVDQLAAEQSEMRADDPHSWKGKESDPFWQAARERRRQRRGW